MQLELTMEQMKKLKIEPLSLKQANALSTIQVYEKVNELLQKRNLMKEIYLNQLETMEEEKITEYMRHILVIPQMSEDRIMLMFYPD